MSPKQKETSVLELKLGRKVNEGNEVNQRDPINCRSHWINYSPTYKTPNQKRRLSFICSCFLTPLHVSSPINSNSEICLFFPVHTVNCLNLCLISSLKIVIVFQQIPIPLGLRSHPNYSMNYLLNHTSNHATFLSKNLVMVPQFPIGNFLTWHWSFFIIRLQYIFPI